MRAVDDVPAGTAGARAELRAALVAYLELLQAEDVPFQGGVLTALGLLDDPSLADADALSRAARAYGRAFGGAGTLGDLVIDRDDAEARRAVNEHKARLEDSVKACVRRGLALVRG